MQALEMEEVESLVGARNRKKLGRSASKADTQILGAAMKKNFMTKVLVAAAIAMFALFYIASSEDIPDSIGNGSVDNKGQATPVPTAAFVEGVPSDPTESPVEDPQPVETPTEPAAEPPISPPTESPVPDSPAESPTEPAAEPPVSPPTESPVPDSPAESPGSSGAVGKKLFEDGEYVYSNFAKVKPLVDHPLPDDEKKAELGEKYGIWHFWDGEEENRPDDDYMAEYPNRDMPGDDMPDDVWQVDAVFVNHLLDDADTLITRAMEALYIELGHPKPTDTDDMIARMKLLHWSKVDMATSDGPPPKYSRKGDRGDGGWTTERSFDGLVRRLLHAMMTSDTFTVVMGGHSAAAGQGNHFRQSYMMQFHKVLEPIFARLGVRLITRNVGMGGLGTIHNGLGSGSIYGDEVDLLIWDSGMTEGQDAPHIDVFLRQGLIGGNRVPVLWGGSFDLLKMLHEEADADVGEFGWGLDAAVEAKSKEHFDSLPYAVKGLKCKEDVQNLCDEEPRFCAKCWIDRDDGIKPEAAQFGLPKGQVKWHPGWRMHQLIGRNMAMGMLSALQSAVNLWNENVMGGPPLDDEFWHVTEYYENIRSKVKKLDTALGECYNAENLPDRVCNTPLKARTQYTPRANFHESSLTSIIKPTADGYIPKNEITALYEGQDAHNTCFDLPEDAIDVFDVVSARRRLSSSHVSALGDQNAVSSYNIDANGSYNRSLDETEVIPGKGWEVWGEPQGYCDGTYNSVCALQTDSECALYGHHDGRGGIIGNEFSGWLVLTLKDVTEGLIMIKLHTWHTEDENLITKGWTAVNNEVERRRLRDGKQKLDTSPQSVGSEVNDGDRNLPRNLVRSTDTVDLPDTFVFEYAIDGKVTTLSKDEFLERNHHIKRVVEILTLLDDKDFTSEAKDVEIAIRMRGCGRVCTFALTHVYWA